MLMWLNLRNLTSNVKVKNLILNYISLYNWSPKQETFFMNYIKNIQAIKEIFMFYWYLTTIISNPALSDEASEWKQVHRFRYWKTEQFSWTSLRLGLTDQPLYKGKVSVRSSGSFNIKVNQGVFKDNSFWQLKIIIIKDIRCI